MADARKIVTEAIEGEKESLRGIGQELWANPELGFKEVIAHRVLTDYLESKGFTVDRGYCDIKTAFRARYVTIRDLFTLFPLGLDQVHLTFVSYVNTMLYQR